MFKIGGIEVAFISLFWPYLMLSGYYNTFYGDKIFSI